MKRPYLAIECPYCWHTCPLVKDIDKKRLYHFECPICGIAKTVERKDIKIVKERDKDERDDSAQ